MLGSKPGLIFINTAEDWKYRFGVWALGLLPFRFCKDQETKSGSVLEYVNRAFQTKLEKKIELYHFQRTEWADVSGWNRVFNQRKPWLACAYELAGQPPATAPRTLLSP